jgi:hypothetical protein
MFKIGPGPESGHKMEEPQGYEVEFFAGGVFTEMRVYAYTDELLMAQRICTWVRTGLMG